MTTATADKTSNYIKEQESIHILATSEEEARLMEAQVIAEGGTLRRTTIWKGVVPPNSFINIDAYTRMSTPEYFFLRKCNTMPYEGAVVLGNELCGYYTTKLTCPDYPIWYWEALNEPRTTKAKLEAYLRQCEDAPEVQLALDILPHVEDGRAMP